MLVDDRRIKARDSQRGISHYVFRFLCQLSIPYAIPIVLCAVYGRFRGRLFRGTLRKTSLRGAHAADFVVLFLKWGQLSGGGEKWSEALWTILI